MEEGQGLWISVCTGHVDFQRRPVVNGREFVMMEHDPSGCGTRGMLSKFLLDAWVAWVAPDSGGGLSG